jgi:hypothetical protein
MRDGVNLDETLSRVFNADIARIAVRKLQAR